MQALGGEDVTADQSDQRLQRRRAGADPVRQGGDVELDALTGIHGTLTVQRLVLAELDIEDHRQRARARPAAGDRMEGGRRLSDPLAGPAGELLPHGLDYLPLPRHHLQRLGDVLAQLGELASAAGTGAGRRDYDPLARQMRRQRAPDWPATREVLCCCSLRCPPPSGDLRLGGVGLQVLELQLELVEHLAAALGRAAVLLTAQLGDQQLQMRDHRLRARDPSLGLAPRLALARRAAFRASISSGKASGVVTSPIVP